MCPRMVEPKVDNPTNTTTKMYSHYENKADVKGHSTPCLQKSKPKVYTTTLEVIIIRVSVKFGTALAINV